LELIDRTTPISNFLRENEPEQKKDVDDDEQLRRELRYGAIRIATQQHSLDFIDYYHEREGCTFLA
jgi:hypothetical protein